MHYPLHLLLYQKTREFRGLTTYYHPVFFRDSNLMFSSFVWGNINHIFPQPWSQAIYPAGTFVCQKMFLQATALLYLQDSFIIFLFLFHFEKAVPLSFLRRMLRQSPGRANNSPFQKTAVLVIADSCWQPPALPEFALFFSLLCTR